MTAMSSSGTSWLSPPMKICTPCAWLETSSNCSRLVLCSKTSNSRRSLSMLDDRSSTSSSLRSPEMNTWSSSSAMALLPASTAACISADMSRRRSCNSTRKWLRTASKLMPA
ncbi:hypothetical protein D3C81_1561740 [compost metagenome]